MSKSVLFMLLGQMIIVAIAAIVVSVSIFHPMGPRSPSFWFDYGVLFSAVSIAYWIAAIIIWLCVRLALSFGR